MPRHVTIHPSVLYVGTPVILVGTQNPDGSANLAPASSYWALGQMLALGLEADGQSVANVLERPELTVSFPSPELWRSVEALGDVTGRSPVPDGKAARFIVTHEGDAMGPEGVEHVEMFPDAIKTMLKETSLAGARVYIGGSGSNDKDIKQYAMSDLLIAAIAAFVLIFLIMMFITRSLVAAFVIPATVAFSYAGAFGLSILLWQHLIGLPLHWLILPLTFITGLLGMNVKGIPYADQPWAFDGVMAVCAVLAAGITVYFVRRHWFR